VHKRTAGRSSEWRVQFSAAAWTCWESPLMSLRLAGCSTPEPRRLRKPDHRRWMFVWTNVQCTYIPTVRHPDSMALLGRFRVEKIKSANRPTAFYLPVTQFTLFCSFTKQRTEQKLNKSIKSIILTSLIFLTSYILQANPQNSVNFDN